VGQWVPVAGVSENALKARRDRIVAVTNVPLSARCGNAFSSSEHAIKVFVASPVQ